MKPIPICPECKQELKPTGTLRPGQAKPKRVFTCMACPNNKSYLRNGMEINR